MKLIQMLAKANTIRVNASNVHDRVAFNLTCKIKIYGPSFLANRALFSGSNILLDTIHYFELLGGDKMIFYATSSKKSSLEALLECTFVHVSVQLCLNLWKLR